MPKEGITLAIKGGGKVERGRKHPQDKGKKEDEPRGFSREGRSNAGYDKPHRKRHKNTVVFSSGRNSKGP